VSTKPEQDHIADIDGQQEMTSRQAPLSLGIRGAGNGR